MTKTPQPQAILLIHIQRSIRSFKQNILPINSDLLHIHTAGMSTIHRHSTVIYQHRSAKIVTNKNLLIKPLYKPCLSIKQWMRVEITIKRRVMINTLICCQINLVIIKKNILYKTNLQICRL